MSIATLLSQYHKVYAVDIVPSKVELINQRKSPIQDEYIEMYLSEKELDLTATLDAEMLGLKKIKPDARIDGKKHLYAIGSVLTAGIQDATVWGSGVLNAKLTYRLEKRKLDVRAVRGPVTRAILMDYGYSVPKVYGDPAIIMPEIYKAVPLKNRKKYGLITHKDYILNEKYEENKIARLNICTDDYQDFLNQLVNV